MEQDQVTNIADVVLPVEVVTLAHLRTRAGEPVRVRCEALDELVVADAFKRLGGERPPEVAALVDPTDLEAATETLRQLNVVAPALIEAGTSLDGPDGSEVRPAFYFGDRRPHPLSIPGRLLRQEDRVNLCATIMRLGGYMGGAAGATFHGGERGGRDGGVGVVAAGPLERDAAVPADGALAGAVGAAGGLEPGPVGATAAAPAGTDGP
jgi:hypothetical protein